ncbi:MAG: hypothetical protein M3357_07100 [Actinomycetota bacterium]|nr:hypothetical protein [Actinomycetota bacterium]
MPLALVLIARAILVPVGARLGSRGEAGTVAAALLTVLVTVGAMSTLV